MASPPDQGQSRAALWLTLAISLLAISPGWLGGIFTRTLQLSQDPHLASSTPGGAPPQASAPPGLYPAQPEPPWRESAPPAAREPPRAAADPPAVEPSESPLLAPAPAAPAVPATAAASAEAATSAAPAAPATRAAPWWPPTRAAKAAAVDTSQCAGAPAPKGEKPRKDLKQCWWPPNGFREDESAPLCGASSWWETYAARHRETMGAFARGGRLNSSQVVVYVAREGDWSGPFGSEGRRSGGVSDRFTGIVTLFMFAVATGRAFLIDWKGVMPFLQSPLLGEAMYVESWQKVLRSLPEDSRLELRPKSGAKYPDDVAFNRAGYLLRWGECPGGPDVEDPSLTREAMCLNFPIQTHYQYWALTEMFESRGPILARIGRGAIARMWKSCQSGGGCSPGSWKMDNAMAHWMRDRSLTGRAAFGCLYSMLFQPTELVRKAFEPELKIIGPPHQPAYLDGSSDPRPQDRARCVLLQVRTGDATIQSQGSSHADEMEQARALLKLRRGVFSCAERAAAQLAEKERRSGWQGSAEDVLWFLMTDSKLLQRAAKEKYGSRLFTHEGTVDFYATLGSAGTLSVIGEQWLGTFCGAAVVTYTSGLGRQSVVRTREFMRGESILYFVPDERSDTCSAMSRRGGETRTDSELIEDEMLMGYSGV